MEIPHNLKNLYRHWELYTTAPKSQSDFGAVCTDAKLRNEIEYFIGERMKIWEKKVKGEAMPYTKDPVLSKYRFCNIFREFDRQTIEIHTMLNPLRDDFALWLLNMFYCRMVARPETVQSVGLLSFDKKENKNVYERLMNHPTPRYGTPYVFPVSTILKSDTPTRELCIATHLPRVLKNIVARIEQWNKKSVVDGVKEILPLFGFNHTFLWTEVLIDVAYQYPEYIDLFAKFPIGPGSAPTMKRINRALDPEELVVDLASVFFDTGIMYDNKPLRLSAENWEGIACEFRKYSNLKEGKGRKRIFRTKVLPLS